MKKRWIGLVLAVLMALSCAACQKAPESLTTGPLSLEQDPRFGGIFLHITIEDFEKAGFRYGDSVDVSFSNGYRVEDVPAYNGYYVNIGELLLCAYPGYPYVTLARNFGADPYVEGNLNDQCTGEITLRERGKYADVQAALGMVYTNRREDYADDATFANFRPMAGGRLTEKLFYRSASPCDDQYNRAAYADALCREAGIGYVLDLADSEEKVAGYRRAENSVSPNWTELYDAGKVLPLNMKANYQEPEYAEKVADAMRAVLREKGPFLIHCTEGKDRTGFVCMLLEMLAGATREEIKADYMKTYENYYGVTEESNPKSYRKLVELRLDTMLTFVCEAEDAAQLSTEDCIKGAKHYLTLGGMTEEELGLLERRITE